MSNNKLINLKNKGSKYWIENLVNYHSIYFNDRIKKLDSNIGEIKWITSLDKNDGCCINTKELIKDILNYSENNSNFWPCSEPKWSAVGIDNKGSIILVEAKAHRAETRSMCRITSDSNKAKIKNIMKQTFNSISEDKLFPEEVWMNEYFQFASRLSIFNKLKKDNINVKYVLLNIINDPTFIRTTKAEWDRHYEIVMNKLFGKSEYPLDVYRLDIIGEENQFNIV